MHDPSLDRDQKGIKNIIGTSGDCIREKCVQVKFLGYNSDIVI